MLQLGAQPAERWFVPETTAQRRAVRRILKIDYSFVRISCQRWPSNLSRSLRSGSSTPPPAIGKRATRRFTRHCGSYRRGSETRWRNRGRI